MYRHNGRTLETSARAEQSNLNFDLINAMSFSRIFRTRDPPDCEEREREIYISMRTIRQMRRIFALDLSVQEEKKNIEM